MKRLLATALFATALNFTGAGGALAQEMYLGEIRLFGFNFCPTGWLAASGQLLAINQYAALYSLYGTSFGGNGTTNFGLPNLAGRAPVGPGTPPSGQPYATPYGQSTVTLTVGQLPAHTHALLGTSQPPTTNSPASALDATFTAGEKIFAGPGAPANTAMAATAIGPTGGNQPVPTQSPSLALSWCVAITGIFPTRP